MNKDQRKFLVDEIEKRGRKDKEELRATADKLCELALSQSSELLFKTGSQPALPAA